ncbi:MAG TPA: ATP-binding protein [Acidobacteriaceae bacterium]|nr:ATP-binding protein [Acidobacteriaceae bacterium]
MASEKSSVLVVDDRSANRYTTAHALKRAGFAVMEAATGKEALELAKQLPSVIVLDVKLPDILGYEVCRRIKANPHTSHIPVLQLSASFLDNESKLYALESGADAYLIQPAEPVVLIATVKSLVRLHLAESQARLSATQWQATFDSLNEGVAMVNASGIVQRCNRSMSRLLGRTYGDIENLPLQDLIENCFGFTIDLQSVLASREVQSGTRFFRIRVDPILLQENTIGSIFLLEETTEQKRTEEALLVSERLAATGRIAHTIAHEINNPLEAIVNLVYLLQGSLDDLPLAQGYIASAEKELERVSRISKQILSFNRESSSPVKVCISEVMEDVLALNNRAVIESNLRIRREWSPGLVVHGFPAQLRQVFSNLLRNAMEASPDGAEIRIKISECMLGIRQEPAVRVSIADYGIGIPGENIRRIFDAFFTTKALKGSGVGLWLSSTIVHEHHGRLRVRSSTRPPRTGTCISVMLPVRPTVS